MSDEPLPVKQKKPRKTEDMTTYMREYMRKYYADNKEECKSYKNSLKYKKTHNLPEEEFKEYGIYLADIYKLRQIKKKIPRELFERIMIEEQTITETI